MGKEMSQRDKDSREKEYQGLFDMRIISPSLFPCSSRLVV